ncbi:MAG: HDIG domain-containing protein [Paludibacteraceae bacterium]|nr:HDIG domain-containing protein [Paludibacteraceae bacterium]
MNAIELIQKYYVPGTDVYDILTVHSLRVAEKALALARKHPELELDLTFVEEAALLHDIGIRYCLAPSIDCHGEHPYVCHGYLGADLLRREGLPKHALVAERHTGTGLKHDYIVENGLPLPLDRLYEPQSLEEQLICYADKFFSKTHPDQEKPVEKVEASLAKWGDASVEQFLKWKNLFD